MTDTERANLKRLAEKATPGPWFVGNWFGRCLMEHKHNGRDCRYTYDKPSEDYQPEGTGISSRTPGRGVVRSGYDGAEIDETDARFIAAANPDAVLDLLKDADNAVRALNSVGVPERDCVADRVLWLAEQNESLAAEAQRLREDAKEREMELVHGDDL